MAIFDVPAKPVAAWDTANEIRVAFQGARAVIQRAVELGLQIYTDAKVAGEVDAILKADADDLRAKHDVLVTALAGLTGEAEKPKLPPVKAV